MAGIFISCFPIFPPNMSGISAAGRKDMADKILKISNARKIKSLAERLPDPEDWDVKGKKYMRLISLAKFAENRDLREKLLATGTKEIAEATGNEYWGVGAYLGDKRIQEHRWTGQNWLGRILQDTRSILRGECHTTRKSLIHSTLT